MIRVCTYCEVEGKPAVMGEKEPLDDKRETHGACKEHVKVMRDPACERVWHERWKERMPWKR